MSVTAWAFVIYRLTHTWAILPCNDPILSSTPLCRKEFLYLRTLLLRLVSIAQRPFRLHKRISCGTLLHNPDSVVLWSSLNQSVSDSSFAGVKVRTSGTSPTESEY